MSAIFVAQNHPYDALTDAGGKFEIADIPPGDYDVEIWHEKLGKKTGKAGIWVGADSHSHAWASRRYLTSEPLGLGNDRPDDVAADAGRALHASEEACRARTSTAPGLQGRDLAATVHHHDGFAVRGATNVPAHVVP